VASRRSPTLGVDTIYVAVPVPLPDGNAVARAAGRMEGLAGSLRALRLQLLAGLLLALLLSAGVGLVAARRVALPLRELTLGAERFSRGDYSVRLPPHRVREIDDLAASFNRAAEALAARLEAETRRGDEREAVLGSMGEGVLAVDPAERILSLNPAAAALLGLAGEEAVGRALQEAVRNSELHGIVGRTLREGAPGEGEITLGGNGGERALKVTASPLVDRRGAVIGGLFVLADITRLRRLEKVRSDFVANVSHELRTPITSIKAAAETLLAGAKGDPAALERFLGMIAKHSERLNSLVEDLLRLSRIEREGERGGVPLAPGPVAEVLEEAVEAIRPLAEAGRHPVEVVCPPGLTVLRDPALLTQAVVNLLDNAVKYSGEGRPIRVTGRQAPGGAEIEVRDEGNGIPPEHLPRLFERFYRVDPARSRTLGGTGLGLAIVKHIVAAHHGTVSVKSEPGKGSAFTIRLPS